MTAQMSHSGPALAVHETFFERKPAIPKTRFSTALLPPGDVHEIWRESMASVFDVTIPTEGPDLFEADLTTWNLGEMLVSRTFIGAQRFERDRKLLRRDDVDHILVQLYNDGGYRGIAGDQPITLNAGEVSILDLSKATATHALASSTTTLVVPRALLADALSINGLHGLVVGGACGRLLADHLKALVDHLPTATLDEAPAISRGTIQMIAAMVAPTRAALGVASEVIESTLKARTVQYIDKHLDEPQLSPDHLCSRLGVTRSTLYRLFETNGGIAAFIRDRRLAHVQRALRDPLDKRRIGEIAESVGFTNPISFSRAFKRDLGITPGEYREHAMQTVTDWESAILQAPDAMPRFDVWLKSLRKI